MACCDSKNSISSFNRQIDIETLTHTPNSSGGQATVWSPFLQNIWASIKPKTKWEQNFGQRLEPRTVHEIRCRYQAGVHTKMRIKYGTRIFQIKSVINDDEANKYLTITCEESPGT